MKYLALSIVVIASLHLAMTIDVSVHALCPDKALDILKRVDDILKDIDFEVLKREEKLPEMISRLSKGEIDSILAFNNLVANSKLRKSLPLSNVRFAIFGKSSGTVGTLQGFENSAFMEFGQKNVRFYKDIHQVKKAFLEGKIEGVFLPETASRYIEGGFERRDELGACVLVFSEKISERMINEINSAILKTYRNFENPPNEITLQVLDHPPYGYMNGGIWTGPDVEKVKEIFSSLGYRVKFVSYPRLRSFQYLRSGYIDGVFLVERTSELERFLEFVEVPLRSESDVMFTLKKLENGFRPKSGMFKSCGFVKGYSCEDLLMKFCQKIFKVKDVEIGLKLLKLGRIDAFVTGYLSGSFQIERLGLKDVVRSSPIRNCDYYLALSRKSSHVALVPFLEMELRKLREKSGR